MSQSVTLPSIRDLFPDYLSKYDGTETSRCVFRTSSNTKFKAQASTSKHPRCDEAGLDSSNQARKCPPTKASFKANVSPLFIEHAPSSSTSVLVCHPESTTTSASLPLTETCSNQDASMGYSNLTKGISRRHHICPVQTCAKTFTSPGHLRTHFIIHTGAKPFRCPHPGCNKEYNVSSNMKRHLRSHARDTTTNLELIDVDEVSS